MSGTPVIYCPRCGLTPFDPEDGPPPWSACVTCHGPVQMVRVLLMEGDPPERTFRPVPKDSK